MYRTTGGMPPVDVRAVAIAAPRTDGMRRGAHDVDMHEADTHDADARHGGV